MEHPGDVKAKNTNTNIKFIERENKEIFSEELTRNRFVPGQYWSVAFVSIADPNHIDVNKKDCLNLYGIESSPLWNILVDGF